MKESQLLESITRDSILQAIETIDKEGYPSNRSSSTYDLVYDDTTYPPKYVTSLAGYFANGYFIPHSKFSGGESSTCFARLRELGFEILEKSQTKTLKKAESTRADIHLKYVNHETTSALDTTLLEKLFKQYVEHCNNTDWLTARESYKFKFGRWVDDRIDFNSQNDQEILEICIASQDQVFYKNSNVKGVNFIKSNLRFKDNFIGLVDVQNLRMLFEGKLINNESFKRSELSFPKFSCWSGTLIPRRFKPYANDSLIKSIVYFFHLESYSKSGMKGFNLANTLLNHIAEYLIENKEEDLKQLVSLLFPNDTELRAVDISWLVEDFMLYLERQVLAEDISYYWVNQGSSFKNEMKRGIIAAPDSNIHHHKRLRDLKIGDRLIHYSDKAIRATSVVKETFRIEDRPYELEEYAEEEVLIVDVDYKVLDDPISLTKIREIFKNRRDVLPKKYSPLTTNLGINQAYCLEFNETAFKLIFESAEYGDNYSPSDLADKDLSYRITTPMKYPLNQILYGPPGTGKTYATKELAVRIANPNLRLDGLNEEEKRMKVIEAYNKLIEEGRAQFTTFHQSFGYEDFVEGIKPVLSTEDAENDLREISYEIKPGILKQLVQRINKNGEDKNHILIIDEINRGNVSAIFGELITLIEEDKRMGAREELSVTLPYSRESFSIPKNLYIIGTMNTADRSVEALDTALRRRFSFIEKMPDPQLLNGESVAGINLNQLLGTINNRVEQLLDRDHTIGHSYFYNVKSTRDLARVFQDKIIPLLQEYFYGDYGKLGLVLGSSFVEAKEFKNDIFSDFDYEGVEDYSYAKYSMMPIDEDNIEGAIRNLLGDEKEEVNA